MAKCYSCPYKFDAQRKYGVVYHCMVTMGSLDITYYCEEPHDNEENPLCPFINHALRFPGIDYGKYKL